MNKLECKLCGKKCKSSSGLGLHIKTHRITSEEYYINYLYIGNSPKCKLCDNTTKFENFSNGYHSYCSVKCSANDKDLQKIKSNTKLFIYGDKNYNNSEKMKFTKLSKYGNSGYNNIEKIKKTNLKKYGVDNISNVDFIKKKKKTTLLKNYGVDNPSKSKVIMERKIKTFMGIYGVDNPSKNNKIIQKIRLKAIKRKKIQGNGFQPNYNPEACKIIEQYGKEHGYNFQHAENGGEYHIKELGYFVDGYDKEQNVVIEYYEPFHKKQTDRDERRKQEIIDHLGCKFIILYE